MHLTKYLSPENIVCNFDASDKNSFFHEAVSLICSRFSHYRYNDVLTLFQQRESTMSTGIGNGIAIPHILYNEAERSQLYIFRLKLPIDFSSLDSQPVSIIFLFIAEPSINPTEHLQILAKLGLMLKKPGFIDDLHNAANEDAVYEAVERHD